jgi:hypothetical protein
MARPKTTELKLQRARKLIQEARELPVPAEGGVSNFSYVSKIKALMGEAKDLIKFIPRSVTAQPSQKDEAKQLIEETEHTQKELLRWKPGG